MVLLYSIVFQTITNRVTDSTINDDTENIKPSRNIRINWLNAVHVSAWQANLTPPHPGSPRLHPFSPRVGGGELSVLLCSIAGAALAFTLKQKNHEHKETRFVFKFELFYQKNYKWSAGLRNLMTCCNFNEKSVIVFIDTTFPLFFWWLCFSGVINVSLYLQSNNDIKILPFG